MVCFIVNLFCPVEGRKHDIGMLEDSVCVFNNSKDMAQITIFFVCMGIKPTSWDHASWFVLRLQELHILHLSVIKPSKLEAMYYKLC